MIAFDHTVDGDFDIYAVRSDGSGAPALLFTSEYDDLFPSWSPDGARLAFSSNGSGNFDVFSLELATGLVNRLTESPGDDLFPKWSPDGQSIAFFSQRDGNDEVYTIGSHGGEERRLTSHSANDFLPVWSPDGQRIAFVSNRTGEGQAQIFLMRARGDLTPQRLTADPTRATEPGWSPDGGEIVFTSRRDGSNDIYRRLINCPSRPRLPHDLLSIFQGHLLTAPTRFEVAH